MNKSLAELYPQYYKSLPPGIPHDEVDVYVICKMFPVEDDTGALNHARKKLMIPGVRSGGKPMLKDIKEARDTLNRWIAITEAEQQSIRVEPEPVEHTSVLPGGWIVHPFNEMPEALSNEQLIDVRREDGTEYLNCRADRFDWARRDGDVASPITHFRLAKVTQVDAPSDKYWIEHTTDKLPDGLLPDDLVEVKMSNGHMPVAIRYASAWKWFKTSGEIHITHWRRAIPS